MHEAAVDRKVGLATRPYETPTPFVREFSFTLVPSLSWQMIGFHNKTGKKNVFPTAVPLCGRRAARPKSLNDPTSAGARMRGAGQPDGQAWASAHRTRDERHRGAAPV
jgi:hypothetical protein